MLTFHISFSFIHVPSHPSVPHFSLPPSLPPSLLPSLPPASSTQLTRRTFFEADLTDQYREKEELDLLQAEEKEKREKEREGGGKPPTGKKGERDNSMQ